MDISEIRHRALSSLQVNEVRLDRLVADFSVMLEAGLHPGAQLAVRRHGELVLDLAGGLDGPDARPIDNQSLFQIRSVTKAVVAIVMLTLHHRGRFSFDDLVSSHWPKFAENGKEGITIGDVMSHRSGIPDGPDLPFEQWGDRDAVAASIEAMRPIWPPGTANGYHAASYGWVLDELVYRWEGRSIGELLAEEFAAPLDAPDVYIGLPKSEYPRMAKMVIMNAVPDRRARRSNFINTQEGTTRGKSRVSCIARAGDLAKLMDLLAFEGTLAGRTYFGPEDQSAATRPSNEPGTTDLRLARTIRWGRGFILGDTPDVYGSESRPRVVGHAGGGACVAWADPDEKLSVVFLCNGMIGGDGAWDRYRRIADLVYAALD